MTAVLSSCCSTCFQNKFCTSVSNQLKQTRESEMVVGGGGRRDPSVACQTLLARMKMKRMQGGMNTQKHLDLLKTRFNKLFPR